MNKKTINFKPSQFDSDEIFSACCRSMNGVKIDKKVCIEKLDKIFTNESPNIYLKFDSKENWTPLMFACYFEFKEGVLKLLSLGADPNLPGKDTKTALSISVVKENSEIANILMDAGADHNYVDKWGKTVIFEAVEIKTTKLKDTLETILHYDVDLENKTNNGKNIIEYADKFKNIASNIIRNYMIETVMNKVNPVFSSDSIEIVSSNSVFKI